MHNNDYSNSLPAGKVNAQDEHSPADMRWTVIMPKRSALRNASIAADTAEEAAQSTGWKALVTEAV